MSIVMPFLLLPLERCAPGNFFPKKLCPFVQRIRLMFHTLTDAQRSVWLYGSPVEHSVLAASGSRSKVSANAACAVTRAHSMKWCGSNDKELYSCPECLSWSILNDDEKGQALFNEFIRVAHDGSNDDIAEPRTFINNGVRHPDGTRREGGALDQSGG
jgi:hypothetical protein